METYTLQLSRISKIYKTVFLILYSNVVHSNPPYFVLDEARFFARRAAALSSSLLNTFNCIMETAK